MLLGDGSGGFADQTTFDVGNRPFSVAVGDFDGDGNSDLATANLNSDNVSVLLGDGSGGFATQTTFAVGNGPFSVTVGDFDGDGNSDLATANRFSNNVSVLLGDGSGGFATQTTFAVGDYPSSVTVGDFDGDGNLDLATANNYYGNNNVSVLINTANSAPTITSAATASVLENQTSAIDVNTTDDFDSEGNGLTYSLSGGEDVNLFTMTNTGVVSFINAPDFESPGDGDGDNDYEFQVTVTDSGGLSDSQEITITVTDEVENTNPIITSVATANVLENQTSAIDVNTADDNDSEGNGLTYSLSGGEDVSLFTMTNTGVVSFINAPDFENPSDANEDNNYQLQVTVTDSEGLSDSQDLTITVTDEVENISPTITTAATADVLENQTSAIDVNATDDSDSEGNGLTYSLSGGEDVSLFTMTNTGVVSFINAPDFELPGDADGDNDYEFQVTVTDSGGLSDSQEITVTVTDEVENTSPTISLDTTVSILENGLTTLTGTITDPDVSDTFTLALDWGDSLSPNNTETFNFDSSATGSQTFSIEHQYLDDNPSNTASDTYTIQATVTDNNQETGEDSQELTVNNVAPSLGELTVTSVFIDDDDGDDGEGLSLTIEGTFTDPGSLDLHNGTATWSDGFSGGFEDITLGARSFMITRFLSEEQLENNFPEIGDDPVRIGVDISLFDDDLGTDTTTFEFNVSTDD